MNTETNDILNSVGAAVTSSHHHAKVIIEWGPLAQVEWIAVVVVCATVVWLAICNLSALRSRQLTPSDFKTIDCRMTVSHYMLLFLTMIWFLAFSAAARFCIENVLLRGGSPMGEAQKLMVSLSAQSPFTIACFLVTLTAVHCAIGIAFALRKRNIK